jgi:hypothetical protein
MPPDGVTRLLIPFQKRRARLVAAFIRAAYSALYAAVRHAVKRGNALKTERLSSE